MPQSIRVTASAWRTALEPIVIFFIGALGFVAWTLHAGRDLNWDFLNYHLYLGMHAGGDGLDRNFFPAGGSSYLNPYAYWPLGMMIAAKWPAMVIGGVLAFIQSLAVPATWYLAKQLFPDASRKALTLRVAATAIGVVCPLVLTEVGTSFIDLNTAIPVVLGAALMLKAFTTSSYRTLLFVIAGMCLGLAAALKLTNAQFALAAFLGMTTTCAFRPEVTWKTLLVFGFAEVGGLIAGHGIWGFQLWREFGNPFFPHLNSIFQAAAPTIGANGPQEPISLGGLWDRLSQVRGGLQQRFLPISFSDWLLRPLYMVDPVAGVYVELRSPDARFLALFLLAPFAVWKSRKEYGTNNLIPLLSFFLIGWIVWMFMFGNGRYLIPLMLAAGPILVACANACWPRPSKLGLAAITIFVCVQAALMWEGAKYRWEKEPWQPYWIMAELPKAVTNRPVTFVNFDLQSASWLTAFVRPESRILNPSGVHALPATGTGADKLNRLLADSSEIFAVFSFSFLDAKTLLPFPASPANKIGLAARIGLQVDLDSCQTGKLIETEGRRYGAFVGKAGEKVERLGTRGFFFCHAEYRPETKTEISLHPAYEAVFDKIEDTCPKVFPPRGASVCQGLNCWRIYGSTENRITINELGEVNSDHYGAFDNPFLGSVEELSQDPSKIDCHSTLGRYVPWSSGSNIFSRPTPK